MNKGLIKFAFVVLIIITNPLCFAKTLTIGSIGNNPQQEFAIFTPFSNYLATQLKNYDIQNAKVVVARNISEMAELMKAGKVDIFIDSAYPSIRVAELSGSIINLRRWKKGLKNYHGVVFTVASNKVNNVKDLQGKTIAFKAPFSTAAYFLPKASLTEKGFKFVNKAHITKKTPKSDIKYVFAGSDENIVYWVLHGKVTAGALSSDDFKFYSKLKRNNNRLKILSESMSVPIQFVSYRQNLPLALALKIKNTLLNMDKNKEGQTMLKLFQNTTKFDEYPGIDNKKLETIVNLAKLVKSNSPS